MKFPNKKNIYLLINKTTKYLHAVIYLWYLVNKASKNLINFCLVCVWYKNTLHITFISIFILYTPSHFFLVKIPQAHIALWNIDFFVGGIYSPSLYIFPIILKRVLYFSFPFFFAFTYIISYIFCGISIIEEESFREFSI